MQHRSTSGVQGLVFGGLMAALVVVFALIPGLSLLVPIPLVLVYIRHGGRVGFMTALVAVIMTAAFRGAIQGLLVIPAGIMPGLVFGHGFRKQWKPISIVISSIVVFFIGFALAYVVLRIGMYGGQDPIEMMVSTGPVAELNDQLLITMEQTAATQKPRTEAEAQALENYRQQLVEMRTNKAGVVWVLLPAGLLLGGAVATWINWTLCRWTLPRFGHPVPPTTPFEQFRLPVWLVWIYGGLMLLAPFVLNTPTIVGASWWTKLLYNVIMPLGYVFALAGIAVAYGYLRLREIKPRMATLLLVLAFFLLQGAAFQVFTLLAMWDSIFDFRRLGHGIGKRPPEGTT